MSSSNRRSTNSDVSETRGGEGLEEGGRGGAGGLRSVHPIPPVTVRIPNRHTILLVDDDVAHGERTSEILTSAGFTVRVCTSPHEALALCHEALVVVTSLEMTELPGVALVELLLERRPGLPVILLSDEGSQEAAVGALRSGAYDFVTEPVDAGLLVARVRHAAEFASLSYELDYLRVAKAPVPGRFIGSSAVMQRVQGLIERLATSDVPVLVHGETGTGKELVAQALHENSARRAKPFIAINCAAVPATLLESELFGHVKGAYTDAKADRSGLFVQASGGTLFLDEIGEMSLEMQAKLLRPLQENVVRPVGGNGDVPFDTRIVCATHRDLEQMVAEGEFREDLFYRLHVVNVELPPLRARGNDVLELAHFILAQAALKVGREPLRISPTVAEHLLAYDWPGNVRELQNSMERAVALAHEAHVVLEDLPERIRAYRSDRIVIVAEDPVDIISLEELERRYILRVVKLLGGNKSRAADKLGLDRRTLHRRLESYEADRALTR